MKIFLLLSYVCVASVSAVMITPALPKIEHAYALLHGELEWMVSVFLLGYVLGQLIYAPLSNRYGRINSLRSGLALNLLGLLVCFGAAWTPYYGLLLLGRFLTALGAAAGLSCTFILINELIPKADVKRVMSYTTLSFTLGTTCAVTLGGLITQYLSWQYCFLALLIHGAVMFSLTWQFPETLKKASQLNLVKVFLSYFSAFKSVKLVSFSFVVGMVSVMVYCYAAAAPIYAHNVLLLSPDVYGYWNLVTAIGMLASSPLSVYVTKHYGVMRALFLGLLGIVQGCLLLLWMVVSNVPNPLLFFSAATLLYTSIGLVFPAASFFASNAIEDRAGASGAMSFINLSVGMLAVTIMGYLPLSTLSAFTAIVALFCALSFIAVFSITKPRRAEIEAE